MDTLAKIAASKLNDRDIMWLLGMVRGCTLDAESFRETIDSVFPDDNSRTLFHEKLSDFMEVTENMEIELGEIYDELDITVDEVLEYPVLFRGEVKPYEWINLSQIDCDNLPLDEAGFKTAQLVHGHVPISPVGLIPIEDGRFKILDGRHRVLAFKLNGKEIIPAIVYKSEVEHAIKKTGEENKEVFKRLA